MPIRPDPLPPALRGRVFTAAEARAAGISKARLDGPSARRIHHDLYADASVELDLEGRVRASLLVLPDDAVPVGTTVLALLGVDVGHRPLRFATTHPHAVRRPGLIVHRVRTLPPDRDGWAKAAAAFVAAAVELNLLELVAAGDRLVRTSHVTPDQLAEAAGRARGRGAPLARRAAALVRERVDSPRETWLRLILVLAGLPEPAVNVRYRTELGYLGKPDLSYEVFRLLLEYEGDQHRTDRQQWTYDIERYERFARAGWTVLRITAGSARHPRALVHKVSNALRVGGYAGREPVFDRLWCELFEQLCADPGHRGR